MTKIDLHLGLKAEYCDLDPPSSAKLIVFSQRHRYIVYYRQEYGIFVSPTLYCHTKE